MYAIVTEDEEEVASGTIAVEAIGIARDVGIRIRWRAAIYGKWKMKWKRMRNEEICVIVKRREER